MVHLVQVVAFTLLLLPGLVMVFLPMFPAFWYLMAVASAFGLADGFVHLTAANFAVLAVLFLLSIAVDWSAGLLGARLGGAGWKSLLCGALGGLLGFVILPPLGALAGLFIGVLAGEIFYSGELKRAFRAAGGALAGSISGVLLNAFLALVFIFLFFLLALF